MHGFANFKFNFFSFSIMCPERNYMADTTQFISDLVKILIWFFWRHCAWLVDWLAFFV